jgi:hypothetical protein
LLRISVGNWLLFFKTLRVLSMNKFYYILF